MELKVAKNLKKAKKTKPVIVQAVHLEMIFRTKKLVKVSQERPMQCQAKNVAMIYRVLLFFYKELDRNIRATRTLNSRRNQGT